MAQQVAIERALAFLRGQPHASLDAAGHARLRFLLHGAPPSDADLGVVFEGQRPDGGFAPFWRADYSSLDACGYRLAQAEALGAPRQHAAVRRTIAHLRERQQRDGCFEEDARVADMAPPWAMPGDPAATLYLTANCGFWLALYDPLVDAANAAGRYLHNQLQKGDALASFRQANWLAAGLWHRLGWVKPFDYASAYLSRQLDGFDASDCAWLGATLLAAGVPAMHPLIAAARERLIALQAPDGRWPSADGPERDARVILDALRVLCA
jgi:hypothetical protein